MSDLTGRFTLRDIFVAIFSFAVGFGLIRISLTMNSRTHVLEALTFAIGLFAIGGALGSFVGRIYLGLAGSITGYILGGTILSIPTLGILYLAIRHIDV